MILHGDSLHKLKTLEENSVDAIVTDPPYGLSFMGKAWDYDVPKCELWREVLRVLKPGGHMLAFFGTRTYHRGVVAIEDAGFEIRDQLQWIYGSGFPKSHNLKDEYEGWGTALKPANEPIVLARKPLSESTVAKNVLRWGTGAINVDASRIEGKKRSPEFKNPKSELGYHGGSSNKNLIDWDNAKGRWPANVLLDESAAEMLDAQSGLAKAKPARQGKRGGKGFGFFDDEKSKNENGVWPEDQGGGASRFFYVAKASKAERNKGLEGMPDRIPSQEYGMGAVQGNPRKPAKCTGNEMVKNNHPTVKPVKLMQYLIKLITPPAGVVLDPFMGSGSTGVAAKSLGFKFIGVELNKEYVEIAEKRINSVKQTELAI